MQIELISDPGVFTQTNDCPIWPAGSLAAGGFCTISVTFTPSATTNADRDADDYRQRGGYSADGAAQRDGEIAAVVAADGVYRGGTTPNGTSSRSGRHPDSARVEPSEPVPRVPRPRRRRQRRAIRHTEPVALGGRRRSRRQCELGAIAPRRADPANGRAAKSGAWERRSCRYARDGGTQARWRWDGHGGAGRATCDFHGRLRADPDDRFEAENRRCNPCRMARRDRGDRLNGGARDVLSLAPTHPGFARRSARRSARAASRWMQRLRIASPARSPARHRSRAGRAGKAYLDLSGIVSDQFERAGVTGTYRGVGPCTRCAADRFFSRRAAGGVATGLQMSFVGFTE